MTKKRTRFWLTTQNIPKEVYNDVKKLAELTGISESKIVSRAATLGFEQAKREILAEADERMQEIRQMIE